MEIGLDQATIRRVASHLGMSVPGLYHHVRTREDLLAMAVAHSLGELPLPEDRGQPWEEWLLEYARFVFDALVEQPEIVGQILAGTYNTVRLAQHLEGIFEVLTSRGFSVTESADAYWRLTNAINGAAVAEIRDKAITEGGHSRVEDLRRAVHALGPSSVPLVDDLLTSTDGGGDFDAFENVRMIVDAIARDRQKERKVATSNASPRIKTQQRNPKR